MRKHLILLLIIMSVLSIKTKAQARYYICNQAGQPWGGTSNIQNMNMAFGVGTWNQAFFQTVNPNALLQPTVCFIFMDGSDQGASALNNFLASNLAAIEAWVYAGGKLFLNAAPNLGGNMSFGFGGITLNYPVYNTQAPASPGMNSFPIFLGPSFVSTFTHSGNYYSHADLSGGITVPVQSGTVNPILTEKFWGLGHVMFGGAVVTSFQNPQPSAGNLRANILTLLGGCCGVVAPSITAVASPTSLLCGGGSVTITTSGAPGGTYQTFPGGLTGQTVVVTPSVSTNYNILVTPSVGCMGGATIRILVGVGAPTIAVSGNTSICPGGTVNLNASGANSYSWSTGALTNTIMQTPSQNTFYTVVGTNTNGCSATFTQQVVVNPNPTVTIGGTIAVCNGNSAYLIAGGASSYSWSNGGLANVIMPTPTVATNYSVIGTSSAGCTGTANITVSLGIQPTVTTSGNASICIGQSVSLNAFGANTYSWSNGSLTQSISVSPTVNTTYTVMGTNVGGCFGTATLTVFVGNIPTVSIGGTISVCNGNPAFLIANGATTYSWSNGALTNTIAPSLTVATSYSVIGTTTAGCTGTAIVMVNLGVQPTVSIIGGTLICGVGTVTLSASGANSYSWSNAAITPTIAVSPLFNTVYSVTGTNIGGCFSSAIITVSVGPTPTVSVSGNTLLCSGQTTTLTASGANTYLWNNGFFGSPMIITPSVSISYTATGTSSLGCSSSNSISILVNPTPTVTVTGAGTICIGESATLTANGANTYTWNIGGSTNTVLIVTPTVSSTYTIGGASNGCASTNSLINITVVLCTGFNSYGNIVSDIKIYPNPNNGEFNIESNDKIYSVELIDLFGRIVLTQKQNENNLKINMANTANGIYFVKIKSDNFNEIFKIIKE